MLFERLLIRVLHKVNLLARPMTLGVRTAVFDDLDRVFLVRHTYVSGWHMPGGGVDVGETASAAAARELMEEGGIELLDPPELVSVHLNLNGTRRDHVFFFRCGRFEQKQEKRSDGEIAEAGFYALHDLPEGTTPSTRRRLAELKGSEPADPYW